jgi:hypothetical protein
MRVTIAVVACLAALVRVDSAHAAPESSRAVAAAVCAEPARVVEVVHPGEAIGVDRSAAMPEPPRSAGDRVSAGTVARASVPEPPRSAGDRVSAGTVARASVPEPPRSAGTDEGGTLWCVSPDDPRCQPLDSSGHDGMSIGSAKLSYTAGDGLEGPQPRELAALSGETSYRGSARDGFLGRLERPPNCRAA